MSQVEILAPAGSIETFKAVINAGADAVYVGGNMFSARAYADNFNIEQLREAMDLAHIHNRKVYLTVNTLLKNSELENQLYDFLEPAYENGLDAVIVQDLGVFEFIKKNFPQLHIHASTQMTTTGAYGARLLQEKGATRIVTSRELSLEEISNIKKSANVEIESFVHGALCYCYSGQCALSSAIGTRSGNRGRCAQPCRLSYMPYDSFNVPMTSKESHVLSPKDICTLDILPDIIEAGVYSLKIEGRMKSSEYAAGVVSVYRKYADLYEKKGKSGYCVDPLDYQNLMDLYNRGNFSNGYYVMNNGPQMMCMDRVNHQGVKALKVVECKKGNILCKAVCDINPQDVVEFCSEFTWTSGQSYKKGQLFNIRIPVKLSFPTGQSYYRIRNNKLLNDIDNKYVLNDIKEPVNIFGEFLLGKPAHVVVTCNNSEYEIRGNVVESAMNSPMGSEQIKKQLSKLGNTEFYPNCIELSVDDNIFISVSELNDLRRKMITGLRENLVLRRNVPYCDKPDVSNKTMNQQVNIKNISVTVYSKDILDVVLKYPEISRIYYEISTTNVKELKFITDKVHDSFREIFLVMPYIFRNRAVAFFDQNKQDIIAAGVDGFLVKNLEELQYLRESGISGSIVLDYNVYKFNDRAADFFEDYDIERFTAPLELNKNEIAGMDNHNTELIVYGNMPVMVSAQCVMKNLRKCVCGTNDENGRMYLKDRMGKYMSVVNFCTWCYNIIYNSSTLNLLDNVEEIEECGISSVRVDLMFEDNESADIVLKNAVRAFVGNEKAEMNGNFTKGHFFRGVE